MSLVPSARVTARLKVHGHRHHVCLSSSVDGGDAYLHQRQQWSVLPDGGQPCSCADISQSEPGCAAFKLLYNRQTVTGSLHSLKALQQSAGFECLGADQLEGFPSKEEAVDVAAVVRVGR